MFQLNIFGDKSMQYLATLSVSILSINVGICMTWPSPILPRLLSKDSPIGVTLSLAEGSWVASLFLLGMTIGYLALGILMDKFGRRGTLLMSAVPIFVSWMMILFAKSAIVLYIARLIAGISSVVPTMTSVIYISEIAEPSIRGKLGMLNLLMVEFGSLIVTVIGSYLSYSNTAIICSLVSVVFFITFYWMPESPYFYLRNGRIENATKALKRLRGNADIGKEILKMKVDVEVEMSNKGTFRDVIRTPSYRKAVFLVLGLKTLLQMSGTPALSLYMQIIFDQASTGLNSIQSSIISAAVSIPAIFLGSLLIDKFGRKVLYYYSTTGCAIALFCEATYFYMQNNLNSDMSSLGWLPLFGVLFFNIFRVIGVHTLPSILAGELFPTNVKGICVGIVCIYSGILAFLVSLLFPYAVEAFGIYVCFLIFAISCMCGILFTFFLIPETKGKSLQDIQDGMEKSDKM